MKKKTNYLNYFLAILVVGSILYFLFKPNELLTTDSQSFQTNVYNKVVDDAIQQYDIAKRQGDKIQIAVQASLVSAAYLQAHDEENYDKWKEIEKQANKDAGLVIP